MPESQPRTVVTQIEAAPFTSQEFAEYTRLVAEDYGLNPLTHDALSKFANANLRIGEIKTDFTQTPHNGIRYPVWVDEEGEIHRVIVTRDTYREVVRDLSTIAFGLYTTYLHKDEASRAAASEVLFLANEIYP